MEYERPEKLNGATYKVVTGYGNMYVTINNNDDGNPMEIFATIGKCGGSIMAKTEAIGRLVTLLLQSKVHVSEIVEQLKGITGEQPLAVGDGMSLSIPDSIGKLLERLYLVKKKGKRSKEEYSTDENMDDLPI